MSLWESQDAAQATGGKNTHSWSATGVSIDTRTIQPGDLFVALKANRDGHEFVNNAFDKGAVAALVDHIPEDLDISFPLLVVPDVMEAFRSMARFARNRLRGKVITVTGSVGKTSTKEMLDTILTEQGQTHSSFASYNNHWGVPLTLTRMREDTDFAVIEIGMNHPGEIAPLSVLANPDVALITSVAPAHLAAFESIEGIAEEKLRVLSEIEAGENAVIVLNAYVYRRYKFHPDNRPRRITGLFTSEFSGTKVPLEDPDKVSKAFKAFIFSIRSNVYNYAPNGWSIIEEPEVGWLGELVAEPSSIFDSF